MTAREPHWSPEQVAEREAAARRDKAVTASFNKFVAGSASPDWERYETEKDFFWSRYRRECAQASK